jgi:pSer/pThr/pTyr-binding forkhead associated (FHA) protein
MVEGMDAKDMMMMEVLPKAVLKALTPEAKEAVPLTLLVGEKVVIRDFPFRVGRESRIRKVDGKVERIERPKREDGTPTNDLYLIDRGHLLNISREHFQIEKSGDGYVLVDRGSACGTKIEEVRVGGGHKEGRQVLRDGDVIAVGAKGTPYRFQFVAFDEYEIRKKDQSA